MERPLPREPRGGCDAGNGRDRGNDPIRDAIGDLRDLVQDLSGQPIGGQGSTCGVGGGNSALLNQLQGLVTQLSQLLQSMGRGYGAGSQGCMAGSANPAGSQTNGNDPFAQVLSQLQSMIRNLSSMMGQGGMSGGCNAMPYTPITMLPMPRTPHCDVKPMPCPMSPAPEPYQPLPPFYDCANGWDVPVHHHHHASIW